MPVSPIKEKIKSIIEAYKADFERVNQEERYKWEAVGHYKKNWNIDADNFSEMYAEAFKEAHKLLADVKSESYSDVLDRYNKYRADGLIEFTTFHQSYGYEEFIEGIKPVMDSNDDEQSDIKYSVEDGLFKAFCNKSSMPITKKATLDLGLNKTPTIWKVSLWSTGDNPKY